MNASGHAVSDMDTTPPLRVTRSSPAKNAKQWSQIEKEQLNDMLVWCDELKAYYLKQLELGPGSKQEPPKTPENNLLSSIMEAVNTGKNPQLKQTLKKEQKNS